ncbi:SGNH/GDSL hydrolase family protein [Streptomyces noursei]|uniref:SGNH/GDSL hydrolase family protein n=1 Tax=Streptomyces noursei TaxID=1971 RepID=UPI00167BD9B9|nr:GDSL-type esterase/lipase family protein [Streptomyces noursei]MCZ1018940.1 GDSL-type esterase/lipase family protein [Streptomyces noursei]GGX22896.1 hypothetical protein GCM10010341_50300 [Streptomyces noursei]
MKEQLRLTPQMKEYEEFAYAEMRWLPYLMYANRADHRSKVINTDRHGFRFTHARAGVYSVGDNLPDGPVNVLLGGSTALGFGATGDAHTISSQLSQRGERPWLNLGVAGFNSTQDVILLLLHLHQLPQVENIVVLSGLNNLVVAGLPHPGHEYGQFFFSGEHFRQLEEHTPDQQKRGLKKITEAAKRLGRSDSDSEEPRVPDIKERLALAVNNTALDLDRMKALVGPTGTRIHFVLQPVAPWMEKQPSPEEALLFNELDSHRANAWGLFQPVMAKDVYRTYANELSEVCKARDISFVDMNATLDDAAEPAQWLFVDRAHFIDEGYRIISDAMTSRLDIS